MYKKSGQWKAGVLIGSLLIVAGCQVKPVSPPLVETVAVLLFDSESNEIDAPDIMQRLVYLALKPSAYRVFPIKETNTKLNEFGFVDGGQLSAIDPVKLGKDLGVHALMFGNVESFGYTNIGVYVSRKVNLELMLVDVSTGETIWENIGKAATRKFGLDKESIKENFTKGLADQFADKLLKIPLEQEAKLATRRALRTLPGFRFSGFAKDENTPGALKKGTKRAIKRAIHNK